eukprot:TRINITY_DN7463_c0_g1_i2.p1 TRINITY_DN7463_c0_g1~~TRINITY_DN7463_c0_g1_i2.p1  ORF type:complete len:522 (+),score=90.91 TRINITY_DN7463_c0_g1_i2:996-2561(+)
MRAQPASMEARFLRLQIIYLTDLAWPSDVFVATVAHAALWLPKDAVAVSNRPYHWPERGFKTLGNVSGPVSWTESQPFFLSRLDGEPQTALEDSLVHLYAKVDATWALADLAKKGSASVVSALDGSKRSALFYAQSSVVAQILLEAGAVVDVRDTDAATPLHAAVGCGRTEVVRALLEADADPSVADSAGLQPCAMMPYPLPDEWMQAPWTCEQRRPPELDVTGEGVSTLLHELLSKDASGERAAKILAASGHGMAFDRGYCEVSNARRQVLAVEQLILARADVTRRNQRGLGVLDMIRRPGLTSLLVAARADPDAGDDVIGTPLMRHSGDLDMSRALLSARADAGARNGRGQTALHTAKNYLVAELLMDAGVEANSQDRMRRTPLHMAQVGTVAEALLQRRADVDAKDSQQQTPLHSATSVEIAALLLAAGATADARDRNGRTPLLRQVEMLGQPSHAGGAAAESERIRLDIVRQLLAARADPQGEASSGENPTSLAARNKRDDVTELLVASQPPGRAEL